MTALTEDCPDGPGPRADHRLSRWCGPPTKELPPCPCYPGTGTLRDSGGRCKPDSRTISPRRHASVPVTNPAPRSASDGRCFALPPARPVKRGSGIGGMLFAGHPVPTLRPGRYREPRTNFDFFAITSARWQTFEQLPGYRRWSPVRLRASRAVPHGTPRWPCPACRSPPVSLLATAAWSSLPVHPAAVLLMVRILESCGLPSGSSTSSTDGAARRKRRWLPWIDRIAFTGEDTARRIATAHS